MDDTKVSSLNLALEKCDIANNDLVRSFIRREALEAALAYNRRVHSFPFFWPIISEHVFSVEKVLNVDILVPLYLKDDKTFFRVVKIISEKMILEGQTTEQLITDIQIQPYLLFDNKSLIAHDFISVVPCSFEESVFSFLFKGFIGFF